MKDKVEKGVKWGLFCYGGVEMTVKVVRSGSGCDDDDNGNPDDKDDGDND